MSLPRYPKYKDSGIEWLGEVPEHWEVKRLCFTAHMNPSKSEIVQVDRELPVSFLPMEAIGDDGSLDLERQKSVGEVETGYTYFRDGDVTVAKITPCFENGKGALMRGLLNGVGFGTTELIVARPRVGQITSQYLHAIFRSTEFLSLGEAQMYGAGGQKRIPESFVRNFATAIPPLTEQTLIAAFLDNETAKIDGLVAEQRRLIELLKEKRQAVISHAVTKGLNPQAPMKPSGIESLGNVPTHWEVKPVRRACQIDNTLREPIDKQTRIDLAGEYPYFGPTGILSWINEFGAEGEYFLLGEDGDHFLKFDRQPMTIHVEGKFNVNNHAHLVRGIGTCSTRWACLYFEHRDLLPWLIKQGVGRYKLRKETLVTIPILVPPESEQTQILEKIEQTKATIRSLVVEAQRAIDLLQERRTALISAAVTGKIDVHRLAETEAA